MSSTRSSLRNSRASSQLSAKEKKTILLSRLKSNAEIEFLKKQQSLEHFQFEEEQLKSRRLQEEDLKTKTPSGRTESF